MADHVAITLSGDAALAAALAHVPRAIQTQLLRTGIADALRPVLTDARSRARRRTGALARGLSLRHMRARQGRYGAYVSTPRRADMAKALTRQGRTLARRILGGGRYARKTRQKLLSVGRTLRRLEDRQGYYPAHIELGTRRQPAYPYLRPAYDAKRPQLIASLTASINASLDKEW